MFNNLSSLLSSSSTLAPIPNAEPAEALKEGENRYIGVLFADIKGFTAMSELISADVLQHLLDQLLLSFSERVSKYGGYVDKYEGDRIMAHFGSLQYSENNARRAVYAGLELIEVIDMYNKIRPSIPELSHISTDLAVRVGVNSGMVATGKVGLKREGDFTVYGDVVNLASRMEEMGSPMKVMLPNEMKEALEGYFEFQPFGTLQVKGKSKPVHTWLVACVNAHQYSRKLSQSHFIGRETELGKLASIFSQNLSTQSASIQGKKTDVVSISALAGMGKTRLIKEFCNSLSADCYLLSEISPVYQPPYASFKEVMRNYFRIDDSITPQQAEQRITEAINSLSSDIPDAMYRQLISYIPQMLFISGFAKAHSISSNSLQDVVAVLNNVILILTQAIAISYAAHQKLLLMVFDDLHFCDEASLNALVFLLKNINICEFTNAALPARVMFVISYRKGQKPPITLPGSVNVEDIRLAELNEEQIESFIGKSLSGFHAPKHILAELGRKSAGNPFYIEEWIASIKRRITCGENIDLYDFAIPENVLELVLSRLMNLDKQSIILLQKASAIGITFYKSILAMLDEKLAPKSDIDLTMQHICAIEFLDILNKEQDTEYGFKHSIMHKAVYNSILKVNKKLMHKTIAEIIESEFSETLPQWFFALEHHYQEAGDTGRRIHYLRESIDFAHSVFMNKKTLEYCDKLLSLPDYSYKHEISVLKATVLLDMGLYNEAGALLTELEPEALTDEYILAKTRFLMATGDIASAGAYLDSCMDKISSTASRNMAKILYLDIRRQCKNFPDFEREAGELLCEVSDNLFLRARLENTIALYFQNKADYRKAIEYYDLAIEHGVNHKSLTAKAHHNKANVLCKLGQPEEAMLNYRIALQLARYLDDEGAKARIGCDIGTLYKARGEITKEAEMLKESYEMALNAGNISLAADISYNLAVNLFSQGKLGKAYTAVSKCHKAFQKLGSKKGISYASDLMGDILYTQEKYDDAKQVYVENLAFQQEIGDNEGIAHTYGNLGNIACAEQKSSEAARYYQMQVEMLRAIGDIEGEGKAWYNWATLDEDNGDFSEAIRKAEKALSLFMKGGFDVYIPTVQDCLDELKGKLEETDNLN